MGPGASARNAIRLRAVSVEEPDIAAVAAGAVGDDLLDTPAAGPRALRGSVLRVIGYGGGMALGLISMPRPSTRFSRTSSSSSAPSPQPTSSTREPGLTRRSISRKSGRMSAR